MPNISKAVAIAKRQFARAFPDAVLIPLPDIPRMNEKDRREALARGKWKEVLEQSNVTSDAEYAACHALSALDTPNRVANLVARFGSD